MQRLGMMRSISGVSSMQLKMLQARMPLQVAVSPLQTLQHGSLRTTARSIVAQAAAYQTAVSPPPRSPAPVKPRVFTEYAVYKGKGALCLKTIRPEWQETLGGDISLLRAGTMFMEFAAADQSSAQNGFGERRYDWAKKQTFALSPTEMGGFIVSDQFALMHDPNKGRQGLEGTVMKTLRVQPMADGSGVMLNLTVKDQQLPGGQFFITIPLTGGEYAVIKSVANFIIPRALGFDQVFAAESVAQEPPNGTRPPSEVPPF